MTNPWSPFLEPPRRRPMPLPEPTVKVVRYWVSCLPEDDINANAFTLKVEYRGRGKWIVTDGMWPMLADGTWDFQHLKGDRFDMDTALALAKKQAPKLVVNGWTVADALAGRRPDA